jgi:isopenicillin-N N-acyltransferase-like protein
MLKDKSNEAASPGNKQQSDLNKSFPSFELSGSPQQIGSLAGELYGDRIRSTYKLYLDLFRKIAAAPNPSELTHDKIDARVLSIAAYFATQVQKYFPDIHTEIVACAQASNLSTEQLYVLNSRTEIFHQIKSGKDLNADFAECTALYSPENKLLAQNWDWMPELESLCVVNKVSLPNNLSIITFTEPGIVGKIGMNSSGLGLCLNILFDDCEMNGIPIHILLRAILECHSVKEALTLLESVPLGTSSNILLADRTGAAVNIEIQGKQIIKQHPNSNGLIHTNHYIGKEDSANSTVPGSVERFDRATTLYSQNNSAGINGVKKTLSDSEGLFPICRSYAQGTYFMVGTVAATIADLNSNKLYICKGQPHPLAHWQEYSF